MRRGRRQRGAVAALWVALLLGQWADAALHHHHEAPSVVGTTEEAPCAATHLHARPTPESADCTACLVRTAGVQADARRVLGPAAPVQLHPLATVDARACAAPLRGLGPRGPPAPIDA